MDYIGFSVWCVNSLRGDCLVDSIGFKLVLTSWGGIAGNEEICYVGFRVSRE